MKRRDQCYSIHPKSGRGTGFQATSGNCPSGRQWRYLKGYVITANGYVEATSNYYENGNKGSCLSIINDGKHYHRFFDKEYTARGLVTKAKQFAAEVFKAGSVC